MLGILLALQATCAPVDVCRVVEAAAAVNLAVGRSPKGYRAVVETESASLSRWEGRVEGTAVLENASSTLRWWPSGGLEQRINGWRGATNAVPTTRLATVRIASLIPTTTGERLVLVPRTGPPGPDTERLSAWGMQLVHPLAPDRAAFYRFSGGAVGFRTIGGGEQRVITIEVTPRSDAAGGAILFAGEMDLDPVTRALVRLQGVLREAGRSGRRLPSLYLLSRPGAMMVELVNQRLPDGTWVPLEQRFEIESISKRTWGFGSALRVVTRFHDVSPLTGLAAAEAGPGAGFSLSAAPADSLRHFRAWRVPAGGMTKRVSRDVFARFRNTKSLPAGPPVVTLQGYLPGEFLRINKVEGIYTGVSVLLRLRDAAPGFALHATGGYAWAEETFRGRAGVGWRRGPWILEAGGARELNVTNKFRDQFDNPVLGGLVGRDNWDYLERRGAGVLITRHLDGSGSIARVDAGAVEDRLLTRHMTRSLGGWRLRDNRAITEGTYFRTRALLDWNPEVSPSFMRSGVGFRVEAEHAGGDLDYTRLEARMVARTGRNRLSVFARVHGGVVIADRPPPQQLFEMGGPAGLPGYDYKEFAGDRAMLFRTRITYALPLLDFRRQLTNGTTLPSLAPALSLGFTAGITDAHGTGGAAAVAALGVKRNDRTGELILDPTSGLPRPAAVGDGRVHASFDLRIGLFGDALSVGIARALERGRPLQFIFAFGRQL